jgi:hypothetical protein
MFALPPATGHRLLGRSYSKSAISDIAGAIRSPRRHGQEQCDWEVETSTLTSLPTIAPPLPVLAKAPVINQPRDALAQLNSPLPKASEYPGPVRAKRKVAANPTDANRGLSSDPSGGCPLVGNAELLGSFGAPGYRIQQRYSLDDNPDV